MVRMPRVTMAAVSAAVVAACCQNFDGAAVEVAVPVAVAAAAEDLSLKTAELKHPARNC